MTLATAYPTTSSATFARETPGTPREPVLVALKSYDGCDAALAVAQWLAGDQRRPLHAITVLEQNAEMAAAAADVPALPEHYHAEERAAIVELLEARLSRTQWRHGTSQRVDLVEGPAVLSVTDVARERGAHAIVVGTGQHGALGRLVYGERAVQIARLSDRPVIVVPPNAVAGPVSEAIVAVDFRPASLRAARFAIDLLADGGRLTLVHVKSAVNLREESAGWWEDAYERRTTDLFRRFAASLRPARGITIATRMLHGDVAPMLLAFAREQGAGLIASGGRRHSFIERMLLGSVSTELIRRADCTVVVLPDRGHESGVEVLPAIGGVVESWDADAWPGLIERFGRRNGGRVTQLRLKTASPQGAGSVESGYRLVDTSFDRAASRAEIVLGDPETPSSQLSHRISNVRAVMVSTDATGRDTALRFDTVSGRCTLVLSDDV
ncbi:MAG: universal stress protein [Gemmatimonadaceae bacterium]